MMRNGILRSATLAGTLVSAAGMAYAQDAPKQPDKTASTAHQQKAASKPHKVWTDDDLVTIRRRGDITVAAAQNPTMPVSADAAAAAPANPAPKKSGSDAKTGKAVLSNPKTASEADEMIAWEQRDIDSQQEYVDRVQEQLDQAPADQKEHFQKILAERQQILADVRREQQQLIADKKTLQKKSESGSTVAASQSPQ
jgi:hypothetical protein